MESEPVCEFTICEIGQIKGIYTFKFKFYMTASVPRCLLVIPGTKKQRQCSVREERIRYRIENIRDFHT